ncbi:DNA polymerase III subunit epsilon [Candidatus Riesia sp. GBBU]|nr:DNA polymerase III subunit epsilon [Candidatus Riesia sp. GBBU]
MNKKRQIFLDTETTGINKNGIHYIGHSIIEIGAIETIDRKITGKYFHTYIKPNRKVEVEAFKIHKISNEFLSNKPTFYEISNKFLKFIINSEIIIHNAKFDVGFINYEFSKLNKNFKKIEEICIITDTLSLAKKKFPGKRNSLDALCDRYEIDKSKRVSHSALIDAELLCKVYMVMTGGQIQFNFPKKNDSKFSKKFFRKNQEHSRVKLKILYASKEELLEHEKYLKLIKNRKNLV